MKKSFMFMLILVLSMSVSASVFGAADDLKPVSKITLYDFSEDMFAVSPYMVNVENQINTNISSYNKVIDKVNAQIAAALVSTDAKFIANTKKMLLSYKVVADSEIAGVKSNTSSIEANVKMIIIYQKNLNKNISEAQKVQYRNNINDDLAQIVTKSDKLLVKYSTDPFLKVNTKLQ